MTLNDILKTGNVSIDDYSIKDWNDLIKMLFSNYFKDEKLVEKNLSVLRIELINYIKFVSDTNYVELFNWTFHQFKSTSLTNENFVIEALSKSFHDISNTDKRWMSNILLKPDFQSLSERDKISLLFNAIDEILEGCFKPRLKLLKTFVQYNLKQTDCYEKAYKFGDLIDNLSKLYPKEFMLYAQDPELGISCHQWRNISAHKSYKIEVNERIIVTYNKSGTAISKVLTYGQFYTIYDWVKKIYGVLRFAQVLFTLNYSKEIVEKLGSTDEINVRYEASLLHIITNMGILGFDYQDFSSVDRIFIISFNIKNNVKFETSLIHASQCLDKLACAIYNDNFVRDNYDKVKIRVRHESSSLHGTATVKIDDALTKLTNKISLSDYINLIDFDIIQ